MQFQTICSLSIFFRKLAFQSQASDCTIVIDKIVLFGQQLSEISISKDTAVSELKHPVTINVTLP